MGGKGTNLGLSKVPGVLLVPTEQLFAWQSYKPLFRHPELVSFPGRQDWLPNLRQLHCVLCLNPESSSPGMVASDKHRDLVATEKGACPLQLQG